MDNELKPGTLIFAKVKGYPPWPARINKASSINQGPKNKYPIFFFGTHERYFLGKKDIYLYEEFKEKYATAKKYRGYNEGLKEIEVSPLIKFDDAENEEEQKIIKEKKPKLPKEIKKSKLTETKDVNVDERVSRSGRKIRNPKWFADQVREYLPNFDQEEEPPDINSKLLEQNDTINNNTYDHGIYANYYENQLRRLAINRIKRKYEMLQPKIHSISRAPLPLHLLSGGEDSDEIPWQQSSNMMTDTPTTITTISPNNTTAKSASGMTLSVDEENRPRLSSNHNLLRLENSRHVNHVYVNYYNYGDDDDSSLRASSAAATPKKQLATAIKEPQVKDISTRTSLTPPALITTTTTNKNAFTTTTATATTRGCKRRAHFKARISITSLGGVGGGGAGTSLATSIKASTKWNHHQPISRIQMDLSNHVSPPCTGRSYKENTGLLFNKRNRKRIMIEQLKMKKRMEKIEQKAKEINHYSDEEKLRIIDIEIKKALRAGCTDLNKAYNLLQKIEGINLKDYVRNVPEIIMTLKKIRLFKSDERIRCKAEKLYKKCRIFMKSQAEQILEKENFFDNDLEDEEIINNKTPDYDLIAIPNNNITTTLKEKPTTLTTDSNKPPLLNVHPPTKREEDSGFITSGGGPNSPSFLIKSSDEFQRMFAQGFEEARNGMITNGDSSTITPLTDDALGICGNLDHLFHDLPTFVSDDTLPTSSLSIPPQADSNERRIAQMNSAATVTHNVLRLPSNITTTSTSNHHQDMLVMKTSILSTNYESTATTTTTLPVSTLSFLKQQPYPNANFYHDGNVESRHPWAPPPPLNVLQTTIHDQIIPMEQSNISTNPCPPNNLPEWSQQQHGSEKKVEEEVLGGTDDVLDDSDKFQNLINFQAIKQRVDQFQLQQLQRQKSRSTTEKRHRHRHSRREDDNNSVTAGNDRHHHHYVKSFKRIDDHRNDRQHDNDSGSRSKYDQKNGQPRFHHRNSSSNTFKKYDVVTKRESNAVTVIPKISPQLNQSSSSRRSTATTSAVSGGDEKILRRDLLPADAAPTAGTKKRRLKEGGRDYYYDEKLLY